MVRETMKWTKDYCTNNNSPMFIEYMTYRYHGHSMSDPGITYRSRDEIKHVRDFRDPIGLVKHMLLEQSWSTEKELKDIEKTIRASIEKDVKALLLDESPNFQDMYANVQTTRPYIRGVTHDLSQTDYN